MTSDAKNHTTDEELQAAQAAAAEQQQQPQAEPATDSDEPQAEPAESQEPQAELSEADKMAQQLEQAEQQVAALKDQLLRQMAEFDNYRKRTIKEKSELILSGGQNVLESLLPVLDDLERAEDNMAKSDDVDTLREGVNLIVDKLTKALARHGLKRMETAGAAFDTDFHEAIALVPAQDDAQKGHVIDCVQTGYMLGEKVLRHAKVVVGQ